MAENNQGRRRGRVGPVQVLWMLIAVLLFTACAGSLARPNDEPQAALVGLELNEATARVRSEVFAGGSLDRLNMAAPMALPPGEAFGDDELAVLEQEAANAGDDALIVRTASLELEVEDVAAILLDARGEIAGLGGYVAGSDEYDQGDRRWASVTYRVPVDRFTEAIDSLRGLSTNVVRESTQSQEVTATVVDLEARIANLRASEEALVEIMDRSGRIEDVLAVQLRLEDVRGQIERLEAQRSNLSDQAALSTLAVTWFTPVAAVTVAQEGWSLATEVDAALAQTVESLQGVASLGVWFAVVALPLLLIPLLLMLAVLVVFRRRIHTDAGPATTPTSAE